MSLDTTNSACRRKQKEIEEPCEGIFRSKDEMDRCLWKLCYGDLFILGRIWIQSLRAVLLGVRLCPIPSVHAAPVKKDPEKPKAMRASDLPMYECPHVEYKNSIEEKSCDEKLIHNAVLPHVSEVRQSVQGALSAGKRELCDTYNEIASDLGRVKKRMTTYWRDDKNLNARTGLVATGGLIGYYIGSKGGVPRRLFCAACGVATTGLLCFPAETDAAIRQFFYHTGKLFVWGSNYMTGRNLEIKEHLPCPKPKPPDEKYVIQCQKK